jgi:hypothetical protein
MLLSRSSVTRGYEQWPREIEAALKAATWRIRLRGALRLMASSFILPVFAAAAWLALARFTLIEMPYWPALMFFGIWIAFLPLLIGRQRVSTMQAARYLDRALELDERCSTYVQMRRKRRISRQAPLERAALDRLTADLKWSLGQRGSRLPTPFKLRMRRWQAAALTLAVGLLLASMFVPSPLDAVRAERALLRQAVAKQGQRIAELRADIVNRPDLSERVRSAMLAELDNLEKQLHAKNADRSSILAALSDSHEKLRKLADAPASDFDGLIKAAQIVWTAATFTTLGDPTEREDASDLEKAATALQFMSGYLRQFTTVEEGYVATSLEQASVQAGPRHGALAQDLTDGAAGLRTRDTQVASRAMLDASDKFRQAEADHRTALAVESALTKLEEGRQEVAQTANVTSKKPQVGFRRSDLPGGNRSASSANTPGTGSNQAGGSGSQGQQRGQSNGTPTDGQTDTVDGSNPMVGQNMPALGGPQNPQGAPPNANPSGSTGQQSQSNSSVPGGSDNSQPGGSAGGAGKSGDSSTQGTLQGPITGPVGGAGGAISRVENPAGQGVATSGQATPVAGSGSGAEQVYVPTQGQGAGASPGGNNNPGQPPPQGAPTGGSGGSAVGQSGDDNDGQTRTGAGAVTELRTPYTEVIGEYAERATQAMESAYIPTDAKEYVKQYFTGLGK